jgi:hypothetical protein
MFHRLSLRDTSVVHNRKVIKVHIDKAAIRKENVINSYLSSSLQEAAV